MDKTKREELRELYRSGPERLEACVASVPEEALGYKPGPERWSVHQIVLHVVDADLNSFMRLRKPLAEPGSSVPVYDQDMWADRLHAESIPIHVAFSLFRAFRAYNEAFMDAVTEPEWSMTIKHPERGEITLENVLDIYANHPLWHIDHINRTVDAYNRTRAGESIDPNVSLYTGRP